MRPLNLDVLDIVCVLLTDCRDLLSLSLTCSALRPIAIRNILRNHPVILKNVDTICKFHDFVFSDPTARAHHIIALRIDVAHDETHPEGSERAIDCLVAILKRAASLVSLELHSHANGRPLGYLDHPRLAAAVAELASLRELTIYGRTQKVDFIAAVRSPLKTLVIRFVDPVGGTEPEWSPASLSAALSVIANSLENLSMIYSPVRLVPAGVPADSLLPFTGTQFHALRSLTLHSPTGVLHLPLLLDLFPNLSGTLHLPGYPDAEDGFDDWTPYDSFRMTRERNTRAQDSEQRTWKHLERLICEPETLFMLNLRSRIGLTTVNSCSVEPDSDRMRYLVESLREHPPTRLNLHIQFSLGDEPRAPLIGIIPPEAAAVLTHLTLCVSYRYQAPSDYPTVPWAELWHNTLLPSLLDLHSLTHLRFVFHCDAWVELQSELGPLDGEAIVEDAFLNDVRPASFAFAAVSRSVVDAIPSLRCCFLTTSARVAEMERVAAFSVAERWRESRAWRVATCGNAEAAQATGGTGDWKLVELHDDVAEAIMAKEGLVLSTEEQEAMHWL